MTTLVIDSQSLLWYLEGNPKLSTAARRAMDEPHLLWFVSAIGIAETLSVFEKGPREVTREEFLDFIQTSGRVIVVSVDYSIIHSAMSLRGLDGIHDRIIVATALKMRAVHPDVSLVTSDRVILASNLVPTIW
ncbi:MAG: PIN domain-containing protein [Tepidisphaeraceae bacterium]